jgi:hypothetical protein
MPKIKYREIAFRSDSLKVIQQANTIIGAYQAQGLDLTLRQLYYQFVARGLLANTLRNYQRLASIVDDGRLAGLIDWNTIVDRTRETHTIGSWTGPGAIVQACADQFRVDMWEGQEFRPEVWIEKDALVGVIESVCDEFSVPHLACRGYTSQSEMWRAAQRLLGYRKRGQTPIILHFGDHDPSGIDMTRDIDDRLAMFMRGNNPEIRRLALNMNQVRQYNPPPNPAKSTDSRFAAYLREHGDESWELDALDPTVLQALIRDEIDGLIERDAWDERQGEQDSHRENLTAVAERWTKIETLIADGEL